MSGRGRTKARLATHDSAAAARARELVGHYLGDTEIEPLSRVGDVHIFRLLGRRGEGLYAERDERVNDRPGVWRSRTSTWMRQSTDAVSYVIELDLHAWDAATEAHETGDRRWLDVPKRMRYAERDRRSAEIAGELDRLEFWEVPAGAVPAFLAGLDPQDVRRLAERYVPTLLAAATST